MRSRELATCLSFLSWPGPTDSVLVLSVADDAGQGEPPHQAVPGQLREQVQPRPSRAAPGTCIAKKKVAAIQSFGAVAADFSWDKMHIPTPTS